MFKTAVFKAIYDKTIVLYLKNPKHFSCGLPKEEFSEHVQGKKTAYALPGLVREKELVLFAKSARVHEVQPEPPPLNQDLYAVPPGHLSYHLEIM